jgi:hypothetical protein
MGWMMGDGGPDTAHVERKSGSQRAVGPYVVTIEGVDVFASDLELGRYLLFSGTMLKEVRYEGVAPEGAILSLSYENSDMPEKGTLKMEFRQAFEWDDTPVLELRSPQSPDGQDEQ